MRLITALEIASNYPDNILIEATKARNSDKFGSVMYRMKDGRIHKMMCSYDDSPFDSKELAVEAMEKVAKAAIDYVNENKS